MTIASRLLGFLYGLPPAETRDVVVTRDVPIPMDDGVVLLADHYVPRGGERAPTLLVRSPYGRAQIVGLAYARLFAERGLQVLVQSCRGTFGSGGVFDPLRRERDDGLATVAWMRRQPWFSGKLATMGPSYLGFVQWAIAAETPELGAMSVQVSSSEMRTAMHAGGSFWLATALNWAYLVAHQERGLLHTLLAPFQAVKRVRAVGRHLPLATVDQAIAGAPAPYLREWMEHDGPGDPWWRPLDFSADVERVTAPAHLTGGWYDLFLPHVLADYARLRRAGRAPYLTVGPWAHLSPELPPLSIRDAVTWFRAQLLGDRRGLRDAPVRVLVMGTNVWRDLPEWPPPAVAERWYLGAGGALCTTPPATSEPDRYRYDPADPTPSVGGSSLSVEAGAKDNRALEARPDVLVYTSAPLAADLTVIGPVHAEVFVASSLAHTDVFVRLCDVSPSGRSTNLSDGLLRLRPGAPPADASGCRRVEIALWPTAHCFRAGHRVRVQVSSGAHPRYARNPGTGEPLATATTLAVADQAVFHDPARPSAVVLPVTG
jgi:putative CocE/NonD family hydrolase